MKFAPAFIFGSILISGSAGLELNEVKEGLEEAKSHMHDKLSEVDERLEGKFSDIKDFLKVQISGLNFEEHLIESLWQNVSALYNYLDENDPLVYQEILDPYFSASGDLYEYLESKISPWYDVFDKEEIYDYKFYALVDSYDILYSVVDNKNHKLYDRADSLFEDCYYLLENLSSQIDELDDSRNRVPMRSGADSLSKHKKIHSTFTQNALDSRLEVAQSVAEQRMKAQVNMLKNSSEDSSSSAPTIAVAAISSVIAVVALAVSLVAFRRKSTVIEADSLVAKTENDN